MSDDSTLRRNFWIHVIEGGFYISTGVLMSAQTVFPALVARLGGGNVAIGSIPIIVSLMFFLPQIISANYVRSIPYRKQWTLSLGISQRTLILVLALTMAVFGAHIPALALVGFFVFFVTNQVLAGLGSPVWYDLLAKTTAPSDRGKLMGLRVSAGALLGLVNSFILTLLLSYLSFPYNYSAVFAFAFMLQIASWLVQRNVTETDRSAVEPAIDVRGLIGRLMDILRTNVVFRRFLRSAAVLIIGQMSFGFFMVSAIRKYALSESYVGLFTITMVAAQILTGAFLGWLADRRGHKLALLLCSAASACATGLALVSVSVYFYFAAFFFAGINLGAEVMTRYNFVERCAPQTERPLYVGLMNVALAPFYFSGTFGGWLSDHFGYNVVFATGLIATLGGMILLGRIPDPSRVRSSVPEMS
jgi:MFS family permease